MSTLRLKPCTDPTAPPAQPRVWGHPAAAVHFRDFPPPGTVAPRRVHFFFYSSQQNRAGKRFPLASRQGFLHAPPPFSTMLPLGPPATAERRPV